MRLLFVHQNFPGQYLHLARHYAAQPGNEVIGVGETPNVLARKGEVQGAQILGYDPPRVDPGLSSTDAHLARALQRGRAVAAGAMKLRQSGYRPDVMLAHMGWGEAGLLKDVFPEAPLLTYCEFFYSPAHAGFDPQMPASEDEFIRCRLWNIPFLMALDTADRGVTPTRWQWQQFPPWARPKIEVIHDGIDTDLAAPGPARDEELVTYAAPNLEPYRGFPAFMRALPEIQRRRPKARIVIVGGDHVRYSPALPDGLTYRAVMLAEMAGKIDLSRVEFIRSLPYAEYLALLRRSSVHVYLTVPFVLSWSLIEAMACGCLIVGSQTPPVEEVMRDGDNGLLVDYRDPAALAARVDEALRRERELEPLRRAARRTAVERFDLRRVCLPQQIRLVEKLLA